MNKNDSHRHRDHLSDMFSGAAIVLALTLMSLGTKAIWVYYVGA